MNHEIKLAVRYARRAVELGSCISLRYEKERYTPYSTLKGEWYCPADMQFSEILSVMLNIDGETILCGMPDGLEVERRDNRNVLKVSSKGYSSALLTNQCADKLLTDVLGAKRSGVLALMVEPLGGPVGAWNHVLHLLQRPFKRAARRRNETL